MLERAIDEIQYHVASKWTRGSTLAKILMMFEDVTIPQLEDFDQYKMSETKFLIWKKQVACYVDRLALFKKNIIGLQDFEAEHKKQNLVWIFQSIKGTLFHFFATNL